MAKTPAPAAATGILACAFTQFPYDTKPVPIPGLRRLDQVRSLKLVWRNSRTTIYAVSSQIVDG